MYSIHSQGANLFGDRTYLTEELARDAVVQRFRFDGRYDLARMVESVDLKLPRAGAGDKRFLINDLSTHVQVWIQMH